MKNGIKPLQETVKCRCCELCKTRGIQKDAVENREKKVVLTISEEARGERWG